MFSGSRENLSSGKPILSLNPLITREMVTVALFSESPASDAALKAWRSPIQSYFAIAIFQQTW